MTDFNRHHILYEKDDWMGRKYLRDLRTHRGMILHGVDIEGIHKPLHAYMRSSPLGHGVPRPSRDAAIELFNQILLPYEPGQHLFRTVDQAIGWFAMTDNQPTAEHLLEQREFILGHLALEERLAA